MSVEKRKIGKKKYIARIYIGMTKDGKMKYKNKSFYTYKEAALFENQYTNFKNNALDRMVSDKALFSAVFDAYIDNLEQTKKDNTIRSYRSKYNKWMSEHLATVRIGSLTLLKIERFIEIIRKEGATEKTIAYIKILMYEIMKFASEKGHRYIIENPMEGMDIKRPEYDHTETVQFWTREQANKFLSAAIGSHYYIHFIVLLNTGIRASELAGVEEFYIDFSRGVINIRQQITNYIPKKSEPHLGKGVYVLSPTKNRMSRTVPLNKNAREALELAVKKFSKKKSKNKFLFTSRSGKASKVILKRGSNPTVVQSKLISTKTLANEMKKYCNLSGVPYIGPHGLRHTFAANYLVKGGDLFTLSRLLGHKNISSTQIYAHLTDKFLKSAVNIVELGG